MQNAEARHDAKFINRKNKIAISMESTDIGYFEDLVSTGITCPHMDAFFPNDTQEYYRVIKKDIPLSDNFLPTKIKEGKPRPDACIQKSVSLFDNQEGLISAFFRTPAHKKKTKLIGIFILSQKDGMLKQTFASGHHSWWRSKKFNPHSVKIMEVEV